MKKWTENNKNRFISITQLGTVVFFAQIISSKIHFHITSTDWDNVKFQAGCLSIMSPTCSIHSQSMSAGEQRLLMWQIVVSGNDATINVIVSQRLNLDTSTSLVHGADATGQQLP